MEKIKHFSSVVEKITKAVGFISFAAVFVMMMLNVVDVLLAKFFKSPIVGTYELTQRLLMCAVFTSFAYAQSKKAHINMTILIAVFPRVIRFILFTLMSVISVVAAGAMTYAAAIQMNVAITTGYMTEVLYIPLWPFYLVETIAMAIFTLALIYDTVLYVIAIFRDDYAAMIQEQWS